MCWGAAASIAMVGVGAAATVVALRRGERAPIWFALGYFTVMELLQASGYAVINQCGSVANQAITLLSYLHIAFQPLVINAFAMELLPGAVRARIQTSVYVCCAICTGAILAQLYPFEWAGQCRIGRPLCGDELCLVSGTWHLAWDVPYSGLMLPLEDWLGVQWGLPTYIFAVFGLPILYGAWRLVIFHFLAGPFLASQLTSNPNEIPTVWCLFSIGLVLVVMIPRAREFFEVRRWWAWPSAWQVR